MAYNGFVDSSDCARKSRNENITAEIWNFNSIKANDVIYGKIQCINEADLAEIYSAEREEIFTAGTLVKLGGLKEITKTSPNDTKFFSVISSNPGIILNNKDEDKGLKVALSGKVPCRTIGKIQKFHKLTTSHIPGVAKQKTLLDTLLFKPTVGIALEDNSEIKEKLVTIFIQAQIQ